MDKMNAKTHEPKVYVLESRYHGSNQQLRSIARHTFKHHQLQALRVECRSRSPFLAPFYRLTIRFLEGTSLTRIAGKILRKLFLKGLPPEEIRLSEHDIVLSKTPPFEYPSALLTAGSSATSFHMGDLRRSKRKYVDYIISTPSTPSKSPDYQLDILPTAITYDRFLIEKTGYQYAPYYLLLLGGNAKNIEYCDQDWTSIGDFINKLTFESNKQWLISTSPRTPKAAIKIIKDLCSDEIVKEWILWDADSSKSLIQCLQGACSVFVTEDSASMVSDAVNCRLPTICIRPKEAGYNSLTTPLAESLEQRGRVLRTSTDKLEVVQLENGYFKGFKPVECCWTEDFKKQLQFP